MDRSKRKKGVNSLFMFARVKGTGLIKMGAVELSITFLYLYRLVVAKEFTEVKLDDIIRDYGACMVCGPRRNG